MRLRKSQPPRLRWDMRVSGSTSSAPITDAGSTVRFFDGPSIAQALREIDDEARAGRMVALSEDPRFEDDAAFLRELHGGED